jgi:hypothetical protein
MDATYLIACGIVWQRTGDFEAALELVRAFRSRNPELRLIARTFLFAGQRNLEPCFETVSKLGLPALDEASLSDPWVSSQDCVLTNPN